jgi:hypothetical protein
MGTQPVDMMAPVVEPLEVSRQLPGWRRVRRVVLAGAGIAAVIVLGAFGGGRGSTAGSRSAVTEPVIEPQVAGGDSGPLRDPLISSSGIVISAPAADELVRGSVVEVRGTAVRSIGPATVRIRLGTATLGTAVTVIRQGPFSIAVPVYSPLVPVAAAVAIEADPTSPEPLATGSFRLAGRSAVETWSIAARTVGATCRMTATGSAPLTVGVLRAAIRGPGPDLGVVAMAVRTDDRRDGGRLLGLGQWQAELDIPVVSSVGNGRGWMEIDWNDPTDGTHGTLLARLPACAVPGRGPRG